MQTIEIGIGGMTCASCATRVERALKALRGVAVARVNLASETARVEYDAQVAQLQQIAAAVTDAGYAPVVEEIEFPVRGMSCASCVGRVERALAKLPGVVEARVNLASESARVRYLPATTGLAEFRRQLADAGYEVPAQAAKDADAGEAQRERELGLMRRELYAGIALSFPLAVLAMGMYYAPFHAWLESVGLTEPRLNLVLFALATPVLIWPGRRFFVAGWKA